MGYTRKVRIISIREVLKEFRLNKNNPDKKACMEELIQRMKKARRKTKKFLGLVRRRVARLSGKADWKKRVVKFLGWLPDAEIGRILGVDHNEIWRIRNAEGIKPFDDGYLLGRKLAKMGGLFPKADSEGRK